MVSRQFLARILDETEYDEWDRLVEQSPSGTVYNTSWWVHTLAALTNARAEIIGCFMRDCLCGGCAVYMLQGRSYSRVVYPPTTPYNGFVLGIPETPSYRRRLLHWMGVVEAIGELMEGRYDAVRLRHHYQISDVRALTWRGWTSDVHYTYVVATGDPNDILDRCSSSIRRVRKHAHESGLESGQSEDIETFLPLYVQTYGKSGLRTPLSLSAVREQFREARQRGAATLYVTRDRDGRLLSGLVQLTCGESADTWLLASDPEYLKSGAAICIQLESLMRPAGDARSVDEASANLPALHESEIKLGAALHPVLETCYWRSRVLKMRDALASGLEKGRLRRRHRSRQW